MEMHRLDQDALSHILNDAAEAWSVPGASCAVWTNGELIEAQYGVLNTETQQAVAANSLFQIGSITKVLTANLVMILKDRGLVDLDTPVREYIPDFRIADLTASKEITVRQLLNHTNGMSGDFFRDTGLGPNRLDRYLLNCALLPLAHPVGEAMSYSNSAYCIAGLLVERVSGLSFERAMETWLFEPMGLTQSLVNPLLAPGKSISTGHTPDPNDPDRMKPVDNIYLIGASTAPAGATAMMSASDLVKFSRVHLNGGKTPEGVEVMSAEAVDDMQDIGVTVPIPQRNISHWGLGWFFLEQGDSTLFGHDGGTIGQYSFLRLHKPTGAVIALLTNGGSANDCMFDVFEKTIEPLTGFRHTPLPKAQDTPEDLTRFVGRFETVATVTEFWVEDGELMRKSVMTLDELPIPEPETALVYAGNNSFLNYPKSGGKPSLVSFLDPDENGQFQTLFAGLRRSKRTG